MSGHKRRRDILRVLVGDDGVVHGGVPCLRQGLSPVRVGGPERPPTSGRQPTPPVQDYSGEVSPTSGEPRGPKRLSLFLYQTLDPVVSRKLFT